MNERVNEGANKQRSFFKRIHVTWLFVSHDALNHLFTQRIPSLF